MDNSKQQLLMIPDRAGVKKYLRAGSKRTTKVRAFHISYDKINQRSPPRTAKGTEHGGKKVDTRKRSKATKSRSGTSKSQVLTTSHPPNHDTSHQDEVATKDMHTISGRQSAQNSSDCENISPKTNSRVGNLTRSFRKSAHEKPESVRENRRDNSVVTSDDEIHPAKVLPTKKKSRQGDSIKRGKPASIHPSPSGTKEVSVLSKDAEAAQAALSSPLVRSRRRRTPQSEIENESGLPEQVPNGASAQIVGNSASRTSVHVQRGDEDPSESVDENVRSGRDDSSDEDGDVDTEAGTVNPPIKDISEVHLRRLEGMSPLDLRDRNRSDIVRSRLYSESGVIESLGRDQVEIENKSVNSGNGKRSSSKSGGRRSRSVRSTGKTKTINKTTGKPTKLSRTSKEQITEGEEEDSQTSSVSGVADPDAGDLSRRETSHTVDKLVTPEKVSERKANSSSSSSRRSRKQTNLEIGDVDEGSECLEEGANQEEAKKLAKLQRKLGGMSPLDRTLDLLAKSRAQLRSNMSSPSPSTVTNWKVAVKPNTNKAKGVAKGSTSVPKTHGNKVKSSLVKKPRSGKELKKKAMGNMKTITTPKMDLDSEVEVEENEDEGQVFSSESEMGDEAIPPISTAKRKISDLCDLDILLNCVQEEGKISRNDMKNKRLKTVHDEIISDTTDDILELLELKVQLKHIILSEKKTQTEVTKKRKELLELQQHQRSLHGRISDMKKMKESATNDNANEEEIEEFLKSLGNLYKEDASSMSSGGN